MPGISGGNEMKFRTRDQGGAIAPRRVIEALWQIVDLYSDDERTDYESLSKVDQEGHVFEAIDRVSHWLATVARTERHRR